MAELGSTDDLVFPREDIHAWFNLTYANYLCLSRSILQSMPGDWQYRFVRLLEELDEASQDLFVPRYRVQAVDDGNRFIRDPIPHYDRGRTRVELREVTRHCTCQAEYPDHDEGCPRHY